MLLRISAILTAILLPTLTVPATAQVDGPTWYLQVGAGGTTAGKLSHVGWNRDPLCYPGQRECLKHEGYRWEYKLPTAAGPSLMAALGRHFGRLRFEIGLTYARRDLSQEFVSITFLDGRAIPPPPDASNYRSMEFSAVGGLTSRNIVLAAYYNLLPISARTVIFGGAGVGLAFLRVNDVLYSGAYNCEVGECQPRASTFNNLFYADFTGSAFSGHVYTGAEFKMSAQTVLSLEASLSVLEDLTDVSQYVYHGTPGLTTESTVGRIRYFALMAKVRHRL